MFRLKLPVLLILVFSISSCSIEKKMARQFNQQAHNISVLALRTNYVFKIPDKEISVTNNQSDHVVDSLKMAKTLVLQHLNDDDEFLDFFFSNFTSELKRYGVRLYQENEVERFFDVDTNAWVVSLAQLELEEFDYPIRETEVFGGTLFTFDYKINGIIFNTWFELSKVNEQDSVKPEILFASNYLYDEFYGNFHQNFFTGVVSYRMNHDTITVSNFLEFTANMGRLFAAYTYDYLLNSHLNRTVPPSKRSQYWYRYDPYRKMIFTTTEDKFIPMNN
jgi:hypothetical protein